VIKNQAYDILSANGVGEKQYNQYYRSSNRSDYVQASASGKPDGGYCPYGSGCSQPLNNTPLPVENSPGAKEADASHYPGSNPTGVSPHTKTISRGYGE
jgi:hypothetical protein